MYSLINLSFFNTQNTKKASHGLDTGHIDLSGHSSIKSSSEICSKYLFRGFLMLGDNSSFKW